VTRTVPTAEGRPIRPFARVWVVSSLVLFGLGALWALATPPGAAPDEPTQIVKAAAVVRGELVGASAHGQPEAVTTVTVPASFADDAHLASCFAGRPDVPAGCAPRLSTSSAPMSVGTYVGRYPPLYYLLVGLPTLIWRGSGAVVAMRLLGAMWCALLLGLALAAAVWSRSRLLVAGVAVAITPLVVFLTGVVNPSGLEISAAIATWTGALVLVLDHRRHAPPALTALTAGAATVLALSRGLSDVWLAVVAVVALALVPEAFGLLVRQRRVRRAGLWPALAAAGGAVFVLAASTLSVVPDGIPVPRRSSLFNLVVDALGRTGAIAHQAIGVFGWLDTPSPFLVDAGWAAAVVLVVAAGALWSRRHQRRVLAGLVVACVALPTAIIVSQAARDGLVWQARDGMPLYVGIPLVAGALAGRSIHSRAEARRAKAGAGDHVVPPDGPSLRRLVGVVVTVVAGCQWVDFAWALRRYTVGLDGPLAPWRHVRGGWQPPVPAIVLLLAAAAVAAYYRQLLARLALAALGSDVGAPRLAPIDPALTLPTPTATTLGNGRPRPVTIPVSVTTGATGTAALLTAAAPITTAAPLTAVDATANDDPDERIALQALLQSTVGRG